MMESAIQSIEVSIRFLAKGGMVMIPLLFSSLAAVALIIERLWYYHQARGNSRKLSVQLYPLVENRQFDQAIALCERSRGILPKIFKTVLQNQHRPTEEIEKLVSVAGTLEIQKLSRHVRGLWAIGYVAPLLGLLGSVIGLVRTFINIADLSGHVNPSVLAGGIWEALIATGTGLFIAIPAVIGYYYFEGIIESFAFQMKNESLKLIELIKE